MKNQGTVYGLYDNLTNELFYIGSTLNVNCRIKEHKAAGIKDFTLKAIFVCPESYVRLMESFFITKAILEGKRIINTGMIMKNDGKNIITETKRQQSRIKSMLEIYDKYSYCHLNEFA